MEIKKHILPNHKKPCLDMIPAFIAVHDTGNSSRGADAEAHKRFLDVTTKKVCWHFTVDDSEIIQHLNLNEQGWHIGDGNGPGNTSAIGIEMCINEDGDFESVLQNTAELIVDIWEDLGYIPVLQHHGFLKSNGKRKNCPASLRGLKNGWLDFMRRIANVTYNRDQR
jgi:N-acetylmuramoyl-L-alanine amidase